MAPRTLLIPSLLDDWFPLLQYAFASKRWTPVLLTEDRGLADLGLRYIHSDMCYPAHLVAGQVLSALGSGKYDPTTCGVLIGQAGDECRGSCFVRILRRQLALAGYPQVTLLTLNIREIDKQDRLPIRPAMIPQAPGRGRVGGRPGHPPGPDPPLRGGPRRGGGPPGRLAGAAG